MPNKRKLENVMGNTEPSIRMYAKPYHLRIMQLNEGVNMYD